MDENSLFQTYMSMSTAQLLEILADTTGQAWTPQARAMAARVLDERGKGPATSLEGGTDKESKAPLTAEQLRDRLQAMSVEQLSAVVSDLDGVAWPDAAREMADEMLISRRASVPAPESSAENAHGSSDTGGPPERASTGLNRRFGKSARDRYADAYRGAGAIVGLGKGIKVLGAVLGLGVFFGNLASFNADSVVIAMVRAVIVGTGGWALGVVVAAQGHVLRATLDSAVHSSPFLSVDDRAEVIGLR